MTSCKWAAVRRRGFLYGKAGACPRGQRARATRGGRIGIFGIPPPCPAGWCRVGALRLTDDELEPAGKLKSQDSFEGTFKGTATCRQFLKQAEIDIVGVGLDGSIYAVEVAFHEGGLLYPGGTDQNVLKKMLRTMLILRAYRPEDIGRHIYFASPKVGPKVQKSLENAFDWLGREYPTIDWRLMDSRTSSCGLCGRRRGK